MPRILNERNDSVKFVLSSKGYDSLTIDEPLGWNENGKEYQRHKDYHGAITTTSNSYKFVGSGAEYINTIKDLGGINAEIRLQKFEKDSQDIFQQSTYGVLDLSTWQRELDGITVKFNVSGIEQVLKTRDSESYEIDRETSMSGEVLEPIKTFSIDIEGRELFLKAEFEVKDNDAGYLFIFSDDGNIRSARTPLKSIIINESFEETKEVFTNANQDSAEACFFLKSDIPRTLNISLNNLKTKYRVLDRGRMSDDYFKLSLFRFDTNFNIVQEIEIFKINSPAYTGYENYTETTNSFNATISINEGDSLALQYEVYADFVFDLLDRRQQLYVGLDTTIADSFTVQENSVYEKTNTNVVLYHDLMSRLAEIATGKKDCFKSDLLGRLDLGYGKDGLGSMLAVTHGFWVRGFTKLPLPDPTKNIENLFKPLTTSFRDAYASLDAVHCVGLGFEKIGYKEIIRLEKRDFFYRRVIGIRLPNQIKDPKYSFDVPQFYSTIEVGYDKGGKYEEITGLFEPNTKTKYSTVLTRLKGLYSKVSTYRADATAIEIIRRKPSKKNNTLDTKYDSDIFLLDTINAGNKIRLRKWQDDFSEEPTGIFSPNSAFNLRLSPLNNLFRHGYFISTTFLKYLSSKLRFASSDGNANLKTKLKNSPSYFDYPQATVGDGFAYSENEDIPNNRFKRALLTGEKVEFTHIVDSDLEKLIEGHTIYNGEKIPNLYCLIQFIDENNEIRMGYFNTIKTAGNGNWELLIANV